MYCSKCGLAVTENQAFCPGCGKAVGEKVQRQTLQALEYGRIKVRIRRLSRFWYLFAGLNVALGFAGLILFQSGITGVSGPWEPWPHPPGWGWTMAGSLVWVILISRVVLAMLAGWGLQDHAEWARPVTAVAGAVAFTQFPMGVVLGAYTLAFFIGKGHADLREHSA